MDVNDADPIGLEQIKAEEAPEPELEQSQEKAKAAEVEISAKEERRARFRKATLKCKERFRLRRYTDSSTQQSHLESRLLFWP